MVVNPDSALESRIAMIDFVAFKRYGIPIALSVIFAALVGILCFTPAPQGRPEVTGYMLVWIDFAVVLSLTLHTSNDNAVCINKCLSLFLTFNACASGGSTTYMLFSVHWTWWPGIYVSVLQLHALIVLGSLAICVLISPVYIYYNCRCNRQQQQQHQESVTGI
jgi:hypothetical protein